jgi:hypothetical protein
MIFLGPGLPFEFGVRGKKMESKRDPSSRKALLWMTAKDGLSGGL